MKILIILLLLNSKINCQSLSFDLTRVKNDSNIKLKLVIKNNSEINYYLKANKDFISLIESLNYFYIEVYDSTNKFIRPFYIPSFRISDIKNTGYFIDSGYYNSYIYIKSKSSLENLFYFDINKYQLVLDEQFIAGYKKFKNQKIKIRICYKPFNLKKIKNNHSPYLDSLSSNFVDIQL